MRAQVLGSGGLRGDQDVAAEVVEPANQAADDLGAVAAVKVLRAEIVVLDAVSWWRRTFDSAPR